MQDSTYLSLTNDDLDLLIGDTLLVGELGAKDATDDDKRRIATVWFESRVDEFRNAVCGSQPVRIYVLQSNATEKELCDAVIGALTFLASGVPIPLALLAAKLLRYGLTRLCPDLDPTSQGCAT